MAELRKVGVQFVAEGKEEYIQAINQANQADREISSAWDQMTKQLLQQGLAEKEVISTLQQLGATRADATALVRANSTAVQENTSALNQNTTAQKSNVEGVDKTKTAHSNFYSETRAGRIAVAAITTEMALMTIAAGETLPPALRAAGKGLQQVIDTATAGFLITNTLAGAIGGGLVGGLLALVTVSASVDPHLVDLNNQLDTLAKKQDAVDTLAELTGWTEKDAQAALDMAKENSAAAQTLQKITDAAEHQRNALDALGATLENTHGVIYTLIKGVEAIPEVFGRAGDAANKLTILSLGLASAGETYARALTQGKSPQEAYAAGMEALRNVVIGTREELDKLNQQFAEQSAVQRVIDAQKDLETQLQKDAAGIKDAKQELAAYAQVSNDAADSFLKVANSNQNVATQALDLEQRLKESKMALAELQTAGQGNSEEAQRLQLHILGLSNALHELVLANQGATDSTKKLLDAEQKLADTLQQISDRAGAQYIKYLQDVGRAQQQFTDSIADSETQFNNAMADAAQQRSDRLSDLWIQYADRVADINLNLSQRVFDINQQLTDKLADIQMQLADRIAGIEQQLQNKLADLAHQRDQTQQSINDKIAKAAQDLADKLYQIERDRIEAINALDYNTGERLRQAKTDHDRDAILRQAQFERAQIDQRANDARTDAERAFQEQMQQFRKERQAAQDNYNYQVMLAKQLAAQQIADAQRTAAEQAAIARRTATEQMALAEREAAQQRAQTQRTYDEQKALAERAYQETIARAAREEAQKQDLANRTLGERLKAINQAYEAEMRANDLATQRALENLQKVIEAIGGVVKAWQALLSQWTGNLFNPMFNQMNNWQNGIQGILNNPPPAGGASGLDMTVPEGFPNDSYRIGVSSGERVTVSPANTYNNSAHSMVVNMPIYDATDPQKVARVVSRVLNDAVLGRA